MHIQKGSVEKVDFKPEGYAVINHDIHTSDGQDGAPFQLITKRVTIIDEHDKKSDTNQDSDHQIQSKSVYSTIEHFQTIAVHNGY